MTNLSLVWKGREEHQDRGPSAHLREDAARPRTRVAPPSQQRQDRLPDLHCERRRIRDLRDGHAGDMRRLGRGMECDDLGLLVVRRAAARYRVGSPGPGAAHGAHHPVDQMAWHWGAMMMTANLTVCFVLLYALAPSGDAAPAGGPDTAGLERAVTEAEAGFKKGSVSEADLDAAREQLADARLRAATAKENAPAAMVELKRIADIRSRAVDRTRAALAFGAASAADLDAAQERLTKTQLRIARARGNAKDIIRHLTTLLQKAGARLERTKRLFRIGMAAKDDVAAAEKAQRQAGEDLSAAQRALRQGGSP